MLKFASFTLIILILLAVVAGLSYTGAPYYYYNKVVNKGQNFDWYSLDTRPKNIATPDKSQNLVSENIENDSLWSKFHFKNHMLPIPVKNPYFLVSPIFNFKNETGVTNFGLSISNADKKIISKVFFLPRFDIPAPSKNQRLFEFPIVANKMKNYEIEKVWRDLFSKDLSNWKIDNEEMIYNLYLLEIRAKLFNDSLNRYYYLNNVDKAVVEMNYKDKDYLSEFIFSRRGRTVYPMLIISEKNSIESKRIRFKLIQDVEFVNTTPSLSDIIYREFKNLSYSKQTDHEGMLYLLSAWSHQPARVEFLKESIQYLERGVQNQKQLEPLYKYMFERFGETFAKKSVSGLNLDSQILLKIRLDIEKVQDELKLEKVTPSVKPKNRNLDEEFNQVIEETKKPKKSLKRIRMN